MDLPHWYAMGGWGAFWRFKCPSIKSVLSVGFSVVSYGPFLLFVLPFSPYENVHSLKEIYQSKEMKMEKCTKRMCECQYLIEKCHTYKTTYSTHVTEGLNFFFVFFLYMRSLMPTESLVQNKWSNLKNYSIQVINSLNLFFVFSKYDAIEKVKIKLKYCHCLCLYKKALKISKKVSFTP